MKSPMTLSCLLLLAILLPACDEKESDGQPTDTTSTGATDSDTGSESLTDSGTGNESDTPSATSTQEETATDTETVTESGSETESATETETESESDTTTPGDGYCRYIIPFGGAFPACREYLDTWTPEERVADCANPLMGMAAPGVLDGTPCPTEELLGNCTHDQSASHAVKEYYYTGPADVYETNCTGMMGGTWESTSTGLPDWAGPMTEAEDALISDTDVTVTPDDCSDDICMEPVYTDKTWLTFEPADVTPTIGLVFWPGGNVDPRSYAVIVRAIADAGVLVALPVLPPTAAEQAQDIIDANAGIATWYFGGHSMGGAAAQDMADSFPELITGGLVLYAAPGSSAADISDETFDVLLVSASLDGLSTPTEVDDGKAYLPAGATYVMIDGGNHAQFGHYGDQAGDNPATITRAQQQAQAVAATLSFLGIDR